MPVNPVVHYVKKELPKSTDKNPTLTGLMKSTPDKDKVLYRIPKTSRVGPPVRLDPILYNHEIFQPGDEVLVPREVAAELEIAVRNHEEGILKQMTGTATDNAFVAVEREAQRNFTQRLAAIPGAVEIQRPL